MLRITMENIVKNALQIETTIKSLTNEVIALKQAYTEFQIQKLQADNQEVSKQIEESKRNLIQLEISHGIKQIPLPNVILKSEKSNEQLGKPAENIVLCKSTVETKTSEAKPSSDAVKQAKKDKKKPEKKVEPDTEPPVDIGRLDLRIGKILQAEKHPDADSLYVSKINCGDSNPRTVVSGLVKFVPLEELQGRMVVVLCNLKPVKMRGVLSEAMVMCASTPERVEVLTPPAGSEPGDVVECDGFTRKPDAQLNPKKKIFETVAPDLMTNQSLQACYKNTPLNVPGKGCITSKTLLNVNIK